MKSLGEMLKFTAKRKELKEMLVGDKIGEQEYEIFLFQEFGITKESASGWSDNDIRETIRKYYGEISDFEEIANEIIELVSKYRKGDI